MKWDNQFYYHVCLPMGLSSSCAIFEAFSSSLEWISVHRFGASSVLHILDDFLFIAKTETECQTDLSNFLHLCGYLGVPIAQEKTVGPSQVIQFVGITMLTLSLLTKPFSKLVRRHTVLVYSFNFYHPCNPLLQNALL